MFRTRCRWTWNSKLRIEGYFRNAANLDGARSQGKGVVKPLITAFQKLKTISSQCTHTPVTQRPHLRDRDWPLNGSKMGRDEGTKARGRLGAGTAGAKKFRVKVGRGGLSEEESIRLEMHKKIICDYSQYRGIDGGLDGVVGVEIWEDWPVPLKTLLCIDRKVNY